MDNNVAQHSVKHGKDIAQEAAPDRHANKVYSEQGSTVHDITIAARITYYIRCR
jgi:hypothetical protein